MSTHHLLLDICLWAVSILWLCEFLAKHPGPTLRSRRKRLPPPSSHCERVGQFEVRMHTCALTRRQAD